jgi:hypothetical protein
MLLVRYNIYFNIQLKCYLFSYSMPLQSQWGDYHSAFCSFFCGTVSLCLLGNHYANLPTPPNLVPLWYIIQTSFILSFYLLFYFPFLLLECIYCTRGFIMTIPIRLILYTIYIASIVSSPEPSSFPYLKQLQEVS